MGSDFYSSISSALKEAKRRLAAMDEMIASAPAEFEAVCAAIENAINSLSSIVDGVYEATHGSNIGALQCADGLAKCTSLLQDAKYALGGSASGNKSGKSVIYGNSILGNTKSNSSSNGTSGGGGGAGENMIHLDDGLNGVMQQLAACATNTHVVVNALIMIAASSGSMGNTDDISVFQEKTYSAADEVLVWAELLESFLSNLSKIISNYAELQQAAIARASII